MSEAKEILRRSLEDCGAKFLYREIEDLSAMAFSDKPEHALARVELHGGKLLPMVKSVFNFKEAAQTARLSLQQALPAIKTQLRSKLVTLAQKPDLWLKFADSIITSVNFELAKTNRVWTVEKEQLAKDLKEIFLPYVESYLLPVLEKFFEMIYEATKEPLPMFFDATLGKLQPIQYAAKLHAFNSRKHIQELAISDPTVKRAFQAMLCAENEAIIIDREGDSDKAFQILDGALMADLQQRLNFKGWHIPGARYRVIDGTDDWEKPLNEELELLRVGEAFGLQWARKGNLLELLAKGGSGQLHYTFIKIAVNTLLGEIRKENRRRGINVPQDWSYAEKTEDEIRNRVDKDITALAGREVLDYNLETEDGPISTLEQVNDKQAFTEWQEIEVETQRRALIAEKIAKLSLSVKLSPRLRLVAKLYEKPDEIIAARLERRFGKPLTKGAIRALRHDLLQKLREVASEK